MSTANLDYIAILDTSVRKHSCQTFLNKLNLDKLTPMRRKILFLYSSAPTKPDFTFVVYLPNVF